MKQKSLIILVAVLTAVFALGGSYYSPDPGIIAQGLWSVVPVGLAAILALIHSR